jgi:hypothetical protein
MQLDLCLSKMRTPRRAASGDNSGGVLVGRLGISATPVPLNDTHFEYEKIDPSSSPQHGQVS